MNNIQAKEKANYKASYKFDFVSDTLQNHFFRQETYVVQIGDNMTKGYTYHKFYQDSLRNNNKALFDQLFNNAVREARTRRQKGEGASAFTNSPIISAGSFQSTLFKDYKKQKIRVTENISTHNFVYEEELVPQEWEILNDTITILGYPCQKAICDYRGRSYEAWFTLDIPLSEGPWKFYGLPGLIVKLNDTAKHYSFELFGFQEVDEDIDANIPNNYQKIDRKKFLQTKMGTGGEKIATTDKAKIGMNSSSEKRERHYDYIERDYK